MTKPQRLEIELQAAAIQVQCVISSLYGTSDTERYLNLNEFPCLTLIIRPRRQVGDPSKAVHALLVYIVIQLRCCPNPCIIHHVIPEASLKD